MADELPETLNLLEAESGRLRNELQALQGAWKETLDTLRRTLSERERDLRSILDNIPAMIGYWDAHQRNRFGNHAYLAWFGVDPATMGGKHIREVIGEQRYRLNLPYIEAALRGEPQTFERSIPSPDGSHVRHSLAHYIPDVVDGRVTGFYALVFDVTALKDSQAALRASEERYRAVVSDQTELISRFLPDGRFSFVNGVYCRFFGKAESELLGSRWQPIAHPDDREMIEAQLASLSPAHPLVVIENRVSSGSGELHWMQFVNRAFFDDDGGLVEIQSVGRDITARKLAELALQQANAHLEQRIAERTEQLRRMAIEVTLAEERERQSIARDLHDDLGQLLHVAKFKLGLLGRSLPAERQAELGELEGLLSLASQQVRTLMTQLNPPVLANLGLAAALRWLGSEMERNYDLTVCCDLQDGLPRLASAPASVLFRAARELLINVARHAGCSDALLRLAREGDALLLEVEDFGQRSVCVDTIRAGANSFGLRIIEERIHFLGGGLALTAKVEGGLRVSLRIPFGEALAAAKR